MKTVLMLGAMTLLAACQPAQDVQGNATRTEAEAIASAIRSVTGGADAAEETATSGACGLLKMSEVRDYLPDAAPGEVQTGARSLGIDGCEWNGKGGPVGVQTWVQTDGTAEDEMDFRLMGFVDEMNSPALKSMRIEPVSGVGEEAVAVVEREDAAPGMTRAPALMISRKGQTMVLLQFPSRLAEGNRDQVISRLSAQMKKVQARLP